MTDDNFFEAEPSKGLGCFLLGLVGLQLLVLALQKTMGTRRCLPRLLRERNYNYDRRMKDIDEVTAGSLVVLGAILGGLSDLPGRDTCSVRKRD